MVAKRQLVIGVIVVFAACNTPASECVQLLGPLARVESIVGFSLRADAALDGRGECSLYVWAADRSSKIGNPIVIVDRKHVRNYDLLRAQLGAKKFASSEQLALGTVTGELFVAEDRHVDPAAFEADVRSGVGRTVDPVGAALAHLPPAHHAVLVRDRQRTVQLQLEQRAFTPAQAKELAGKLAAEWR